MRPSAGALPASNPRKEFEMDIRLIPTANPKEKPKDENNLSFGKVFTDYMFMVEYTEGIGWHDARIQPDRKSVV